MTADLQRLTFDIEERLTNRTVARVSDYEGVGRTATTEVQRTALEQIAHGMLRIKPSLVVRIEGDALRAEPAEPPFSDGPLTALDADAVGVVLDALPNSEVVTVTLAHHGPVVFEVGGEAVAVAPVFDDDWAEYRELDDSDIVEVLE